jgi:hypothetical protein
MHRVLPDVNLWIGDLHSASDAARLKEEGITRVVSAMRGGNLPKVEVGFPSSLHLSCRQWREERERKLTSVIRRGAWREWKACRSS